MQLHPTLEKFYLSVLDYSGLKVEDNIFVNKNEKIGDFSLEGKNITLPYFENLKHPNGRLIFHPLNENYVKPEVPLFNLYKRRLVCEINLKLVQLFTTIAHIAVSVELQGKIKNAKLLKFIAECEDMDMTFVENLMKIVKYSKEANDEAFILDIFLKKNGEIKGTPYSAIGKVNFLLYEEVKKVLNSASGDYKVFGCKVRKKDLNILYNLFTIIFTDIEDTDAYSDGTDNKVFRYFNMLLKTAYIVTSRINEIADMLYTIKDDTIVGDLKFSDTWTEVLEEVYGLTNEIRKIPNQNDSSIKESSVRHLSVSEAEVNNPPVDPAQVLRQGMQPPAQVPMQMAGAMPQQVMQPQYQQSMDPNDILKGLTQARMSPGYHPNMQPMVQMPMQAPMPNWMREQEMRASGMTPQQMQYQQMMQNQQQMPPAFPMPPMYPPNQGYPQPYPQQQMMPGYNQQGQFVNPQMMPQQQMQQPSILDPMYTGRARPNL